MQTQGLCFLYLSLYLTNNSSIQANIQAIISQILAIEKNYAGARDILPIRLAYEARQVRCIVPLRENIL